MSLQLVEADWRALFPKAPQPIIDAFVRDTQSLAKAGITETRTRLAYALANVEHECAGFTIKDLTENINYTAKRAAEVWPFNSKAPSRTFKNVADVFAKTGSFAGDAKFKFKLIDLVYGNRMGNRPNTSDGSTYIGRGGPQITGRDGYAEVGQRCGLDLVNNPDLASAPEHQPAILAAFWTWKNLNKFADDGDFLGCVKAWNGGTNGLADRKMAMAGNDPIIRRLSNVANFMPVLDNAA